MREAGGRTPAARATTARHVVLAAWTALTLASALATVRANGAGASLTLGAFLLLPLALPLRGLLRRERRTYAWATLCVTPHFVYGLTEIVANPAVRRLSLSMLAASLVLVAALVTYLRFTRPSVSSATPD